MKKVNDKIFLKSLNVESWKANLADPEKHWKPRFSARTLAYCWESSPQFPPEIQKVFEENDLQIEMLLAIPEYRVELDTGRSPSQNDIFVLAKQGSDYVVIMIEGKVSESFDKKIKFWNDSEGKEKRLKFLCDKLGIGPNDNGELDEYRYQLFHRTVSAILVAEEFCAKKAIMLIHSFGDKNLGFDDYSNFIGLLNNNVTAKINSLHKIKDLNSSIELYIGWIKGDSQYLEM